MALNLTDAIELAINRNADGLVTASDSKSVEQLAPKIATDAQSTWKGPNTDPFSYRSVIFILGLVVVGVTITYAIYTLTPKSYDLRDLPDAFIALGSAAVGALAGLLAPAPRNS